MAKEQYLDYVGLTTYDAEIKSHINDIAKGKSDTSHTHDGRYYTESEMDSKLSGKAASSHNHSASNITSGTLPIARGGTGATTTTGILTNLGITATAAEINKLDGVTATTAELNILDGVTATATELNYVDGVTSNIQTQLNGKAASSHTHNYAGSSSVGGAATSANKLNTNAGDANTPVYFTNGVPVACTSLDLNTSGSSASCTGNAATATKLATARSISLTGDVSGSASFDGSGNVSITTVVADDSHNHVISNVDGLQTALDSKLSTSGGTVGALTGSSTITANGTLSGNANTQTPFSTTTNLYYVNKKLNWNTSSYIQHVVLLFPVLTSSNWFGYNYIDGKFLCWKNGSNVYDVVEVNANCVYNALKYHLEYFGDHSSWELCVCTYNSVSYYALKCPYHANPYTNVEFVGHVRSDLTGGTGTVALPLDVAYYNENTSTILNEEVYESITTTLKTTYVTSVNGTPLHSKDGFTGSLSGNATSATTASACSGNSATATKLATARTISLTGDVTGSASFDGSANASITATVADDSHNHVISNVDGLQTALDVKSDNDHRHYAIPIAVTGQDLNDYTDAGFYTFAAAYTPTNAPSGNTNGWLLVIPWVQGNATVKQIWFRHGSLGSNDTETYVRTKIGTSGWSDWSRYITSDGGTITGDVTLSNADLYVGNVYLNENGSDTGKIFAKNSSGSYVANIQPCNENGNCVIGYGNYDKGSGNTNIYGDNVHIYALNSDGSKPSGAVFVGRNDSNHTLINHEAHLNTSKISDTYIYGRAVHIDTNDTNFIVDSIQLAHTDKATITSFSSGWDVYGTSTTPTVRRYGKVVTLTGALKNTSAITLNTTHVKVFTIPSGYRPSQDLIVVCQGSGISKFLIQIQTDGSVSFGRYGTNTYNEVGSGAWFTFHATWIMD